MRFVRAVVALITVFSLLIGEMLLIGHQLPLSERVKVLHLDECKPPCWIGIVPGKTSVEDAKKRIHDFYTKSYDIDDDGVTIIERATQKPLVKIYVDSVDQKIVDAIRIEPVVIFYQQGEQTIGITPSAAYIGELEAMLGTPSAVSLWAYYGDLNVVMAYEKLHLAIGYYYDDSEYSIKLGILDHFDYIYFTADDTWQFSRKYTDLPWTGFHTYDLSSINRKSIQTN